MISSSVSPSYQQFIYGLTDSIPMQKTLKEQLNTINANAGPFILHTQFFNEKHTGNSPISAFFAKLKHYQIRLVCTTFKLSDVKLISCVLSFSILPDKFNLTLEILRLQTDLTQIALIQILVNKEIQLKILSPNTFNLTSTNALVI